MKVTAGEKTHCYGMNSNKVIERLKDIIFPKRCALCDEPIRGEGIGACDKCVKRIKYCRGHVCVKCGRICDEGHLYCNDCQKIGHVFDAGRFPLSYECVAESIFRFKYHNRPEYAFFYANMIYSELAEWIKSLKADALIPVPLHEARQRKRGYNQAAELSKAISRLTGIPTFDDVAFRIRNTVPQKENDGRQRQINVKKAFIIKENVVKLNTIIIVDDIFTTGSTIDSLAEAFRQTGVTRIFFITVTGAGT